MGYKSGSRDTCLYGSSCMCKCRSGCRRYEEAFGFCVECHCGLAYGSKVYDLYGELICPDCLQVKIEEFKFSHRVRTDR